MKPIVVQFTKDSSPSDPQRPFVIIDGAERFQAARLDNKRQIDAVERVSGDRWVIDPVSLRTTFQRHVIRWLPLAPIAANKYRPKNHWRNFVVCVFPHCTEPVTWIKMPSRTFYCNKHARRREQSRLRDSL